MRRLMSYILILSMFSLIMFDIFGCIWRYIAFVSSQNTFLLLTILKNDFITKNFNYKISIKT
ncbi:unnamed protein product [Chironomus riparius]|uniref:Uncharacterized protein n=1 Tax=Chironomus riparius TaxID=315576 RepID=A0A9N9RPL3_9DIPT|nr:unnamed protein product [Chironomus riparius]